MSVNYLHLLCLMACCISACLAYKPVSSHYGGSHAEYVKPAETAAARAAALTNAAGASAAAAKLDAQDWVELNRFGLEQSRPLLSKSYGSLDPLYAAALPARSFVAEIDPAFQKSSYGGLYGHKTVVLNTGSKLAVAAL